MVSSSTPHAVNKHPPHEESRPDFPHFSILSANREQVRECHRFLLEGQQGEEADLCPTVFFDYMKMVLCTHRPEAFAYTQSLEARVRFAAGMLLGSVVTILLMFFAWAAAIHCGRPWSREWFIVAVSLIAVSIVLWIILAASFWRNRFEEANQVFLAYLAHCSKKNRKPQP